MANRCLLHFIHTPEFDESAIDVPMTDEELRDVQQTLQSNPEAGSVIRGTGGLRKVRAAVKGRGKRGGARVIYYYISATGTIYLLLAYAKSESDDLSKAGKKHLSALAQALEAETK